MTIAENGGQVNNRCSKRGSKPSIFHRGGVLSAALAFDICKMSDEFTKNHKLKRRFFMLSCFYHSYRSKKLLAQTSCIHFPMDRNEIYL